MLIIKGFIIGLAKIIPGVSGSLVALNLGLYEKGIKAISSFFKDVKNNMYFLSNVGIGILLAVIFGSRILYFFLNKYAFLTMIVFVGLLLGSNISFIKKTKTIKEYLYIIITFLLMITLFFVKTNINYEYKNNLINNLYVLFLGFLDATTMIIPALSGTVIFILLGSYNFILSMFSNIFSNIKIFIFFSIGLLIGVFLITKVMNYFLENKKDIIYPIIIGFFLSSMLFLIIEIFKLSYSYIDAFLSIPLFFISYKIGKLSNN